jgi:hypothetical protein
MRAICRWLLRRKRPATIHPARHARTRQFDGQAAPKREAGVQDKEHHPISYVPAGMELWADITDVDTFVISTFISMPKSLGAG